jgi:hypothetical protein
MVAPEATPEAAPPAAAEDQGVSIPPVGAVVTIVYMDFWSDPPRLVLRYHNGDARTWPIFIDVLVARMYESPMWWP